MREHETKDAEAVESAVPQTGAGASSQLAGLQQAAGNRAVQRLVTGMREEIDGEAVSARIGAAERGGMPLDPSVRARVAEAIGADPGPVRVHADAEADSLSRTLGAKAFASGNDLFFREGAFDPSSTEGFDLLLHESTHVLQQAAGPVAGTPTADGALAISDPGDAFERAASAATVAGPAPAPASAGRPVQRAPSELDQYAELGADDAKRTMEDERMHYKEPPVYRSSNVSDVAEAKKMVAMIEGYRTNMQKGSQADGAFTVSPARVTGEKMEANEKAIESLDDYLVTAGEEGRTISSFQGAMKQARVDYERLNAQMTHLLVSHRIKGGTAGEMGGQVIKDAGLSDAATAQSKMQDLETANPAMQALHMQMQSSHKEMVELGQKVGHDQNAVSEKALAYEGSLNAFRDGIPSVKDNPDQAAELGALKSEIETVKKYVGKGLEYAGKGADMLGVPHASDVVSAVGQPVVDFITDTFYEGKLNGIQTKIAQYNAAHTEHAISAKLDDVRQKAHAFTQSIVDYRNTAEAFATSETTFRKSLEQMGKTADGKGGGNHFAEIASVLAEVDVYVAQLDDAIRLGMQEQAAAAQATTARRTVEGGANADGTRDDGLVYYEPYEFFHANGGLNFECMKQELRIHTAGGQGSAQTGSRGKGSTDEVTESLTALQGFRKEIDPMRQELAKAMDLTMENGVPDSVAGPAPTQRSAASGL
jgi:Domain of unknown function (DUF4157)